jgi:hypothetical protein
MSTEPLADLNPGTSTEALARARVRRADLHQVIVDLEEASAAPAAGRVVEWCHRMHDALVEVTAAFERHIAVVEGPEGLFDEVTDAAPHLSNAVDRLRKEHREIRTSIVEALDAVRPMAGAPEHSPDALREAVIAVIDELMRHRQLGADVVYQAYAVDIGTGD